MIEVIEYYISYRQGENNYYVAATLDGKKAFAYITAMNRKHKDRKYEIGNSYEVLYNHEEWFNKG